MFVSFGKTLKKMGGFRIGAHFKLNGVGLVVFGIFIFMFYLIYWTFLLMAWMVYGVFYLYYLMFKGIAYLFGYRKKKSGKKQAKNGDSPVLVYYAPGGKTYHMNRSCAGSENISTTTLNMVEYEDLSPCRRCCKK